MSQSSPLVGSPKNRPEPLRWALTTNLKASGVAASHVAYELVTLMADRAIDGDRFGAATGYAAQALGQESRRPAGFAAPAAPAAQRVESGVSQ